MAMERERIKRSMPNDDLSRGWTDAQCRALLDAAPDAMLVCDAEGRITLVNREVERLFGYPRDELVGQTVELLIPERFRPEHPAHRQSYVNQARVRPMGAALSLRGRRKDGSEFPVEISLSPLESPDGLMVVAAVRDESERETAATRLRTAEAGLGDTHRVLSTLLGNLPGIVYRCRNDDDWTVEFFSDGCLQLTGHHPTAFLEKEVSFGKDIIHADDQERVWTAVQDAVAVKRPFQLEYRIRTSSGDEKWAWERGVGVFADDGALLALEGFITDITELKQAEHERERLERVARERERLAEIGAMVTRVAHDVGNVVAGLSLQAQMIVRRAARDEPIATVLEPAELVVSEARRLDDIIAGFREFARDQRLDLSSIDLDQLLRQMARIWKPMAEERHIELDVRAATGLAPIQADDSKLRRVLDNLVKNAFEAIDRGPGRVSVVARASGADRVEISIEDDGPGIPDGLDVFRMFETTKPHGTGLGLPVSKQFALAHGGDLRVEAVEPRGTVFLVDLPAAGPKARRAARS